MAEDGLEDAARSLAGPEAGDLGPTREGAGRLADGPVRRSAGTSTSTTIVLLAAGVVVTCIAAKYSESAVPPPWLPAMSAWRAPIAMPMQLAADGPNLVLGDGGGHAPQRISSVSVAGMRLLEGEHLAMRSTTEGAEPAWAGGRAMVGERGVEPPRRSRDTGS